MSGYVGLVAVALLWPLVAAVVLVFGRPPPDRRWRPFAWSSAAAVTAAVVLVAATEIVVRTNGTTEAMAGLGAQIVGGACLVGAAVSGLVALVLRLTADR